MSLPNNPTEKADTSFWDNRRGRIFSKKGGLIPGDQVTIFNHGMSMMDELVGKASFFQVLILNVTDRLPERRLADWLEAIFLCVSYPDARIWCNQIGSLAGTMRTSPVAGVSAGILAADSRLYGPGTIQAGVEFITDALIKAKNDIQVKDIVNQFPKRDSNGIPMITGYARPLVGGKDERIQPMEKVTEKLGFTPGEHLKLAYTISKELQQRYKKSMNVVGYCVAFLCDNGLSATEQYRILSTMVHSGVHACYAEATDNPPETFLPLQCKDIDYQGKAPRAVP